MELLKRRPEKIDWAKLPMNVNSEAVEMLKKTQTNLTGIIYRRTLEAVKMLKQNLKK
jgi:hypothetical protein